MGHAVLGGVAGVVWLVLPVMTSTAQEPVPVARGETVAAAPTADGGSATDYVLPLVAVAAAGALGGYGYVRRTRRARSRTTPAILSPAPPTPSPVDVERQARASLVLADDCVRTSREALGDVDGGEPVVRALRAAETELAAAFAIWRRYEEGAPGDDAGRRQALVGVVGRCAEAGRQLDAGAAEFDAEWHAGDALGVAEGRFRRLAGRTGGVAGALAGAGERYGVTAVASVVGYVEQAKDRLVFATGRLNQARQDADSGDDDRSWREVRAAEGAVAQAGVLLGGAERLVRELTTAAGLVPAALTGAEAELTGLRARALPARLGHADAVLAGVREELTGGPYDPLDALRRVVRAVEGTGGGRSGVIAAGAELVARSAVGAADDFVGTHRAAVGAEARALLAGARRAAPADADRLARKARELAERDVRAHGNPFAGEAAQGIGVAGAVLGGVLLGEEADGGPVVAFGGPESRGRLG
ncbi:hypothetical protein [Streptomyces fuscichromogenes]|uniref:TPM domain-containing protein n=1 Tax=Streptomyces fuscichromogenes TaxID=1324013 RepID=A0A918CVQ8_9ACTN|nr:hypothetical protein [Streptomyces fuscichromogenes]GGN36153.1 hypothetical protein GCM10011578_079020 [Streptomyces fuscichromogenes]